MPGEEPDTTEAAPRRQRRWLWIAGLVLALAGAAVAVLFLSETAAGRAFVARQVEARVQPASGLRISVGRIDGSLFSDLSVHTVVLRDLDGPFASAPLVRLSWNPVSVLAGRWRVHVLDIPDARLDRLPRLNPADPDEPLLPDIRLSLGRLDIGRLVVAEAVAGRAETLAIRGRADIAAGRLVTRLDVAGTGGDRLTFALDSEPDRDRFDLEARLFAPRSGLFGEELPADLGLTVSGEGGWARWRGVANARLGADPIATIGLALDAGRIGVSGDLRPGPFLDGAAARLVGPRVAVEGTADLSTARTSPFTLAAQGDGLTLRARGVLDRKTKRLETTELAATLADPAALDRQLSGGPLTLSATLAGRLRQPATRITASAPALAWTSETGSRYALVAPRLDGALDWTRPGPTAVVTLSAAAAEGLPEAAAPLLASPRLAARLRLADGLVRADRLKLTTPSLAATGEATLRPATAAWTFAGTVDLPAYLLEGSGRFAIASTLVARSLADGTAAASGQARVRTLALASATVRDGIGGLPTASLPWAYSERGNRLTVAGGSLTAPDLRAGPIALSWSFETDAFRLDAAGRHRRYGAFALAAGGTTEAPRATLRLADPGLAVGVRTVVLEIAPASGGFTLAGRGETAAGPARLSGFLETADNRPPALRIDAFELLGIMASGRVEQSPDGPFIGTIALDGAGLDATATLAAEGPLQRIALTGTAAQSLLPLETPVRIGAGEADLVALLAADGPRLSGRLRLRNLTRANLSLASLEAEGALAGAGGRGTVRLAGTASGQPVSGTLRGTLEDGLYRLFVEGRIADVPFVSRGPIRLRGGKGGFELLPSAIRVADGELRAAGALGATPRLRLSASRVDLAILRSAGLDLPVRGTLDGDADVAFPAGSLPTGRARFSLAVETPPSPLGERPRIDLALDLVSSRAGLEAAAQLRGTYGSSGRLLVRLAPGEGATLSERLLASRLEGGIRYFGPAETAWSLLDVPDQQLSGSLGLAADFAGTLSEPEISGGVRGEALSWRHLAIGTRITDLLVQGRFSGADLELVRLEGRMGEGPISGRGRIRLSATASRVDLALDLDRARIADNAAYNFRVSGPLALAGTLSDLSLTGRLEVIDGAFHIGRVTTATTADVRVRRRGAPVPAAIPSESRIGLDVTIRSPDSIRVEGLGLDSFWGGRVRLGGDVRIPRLTGEAVAARGTYDFAGRSFEISRGRIGFTGDPWESSILIEATSIADGFEAGVAIEGTARRPTIGFTSNPPLPDDEVLARLLFGSSVADLSVTEAVQLATALASLRGGTGGIDPIGRLRRASGLDRIRLTGSDATTGLGSGIAIGERIGRNLYVEIATDTSGNALTNLQFTLTRVLALLVEVTTLGDASANLRYARDY